MLSGTSVVCFAVFVSTDTFPSVIMTSSLSQLDDACAFRAVGGANLFSLSPDVKRLRADDLACRCANVWIPTLEFRC